MMTKEELLLRLQDIEWDDFEVKEARHELPKNIWETVSAFANTAGGWIVFGVAQRNGAFQVVGVENGEKTEQEFTTVLRSRNKFNIILFPPVLAKLFRCAKLCENAGYEFDKMLLWKENTNREVAFENFVDMSRVVFMLEETVVYDRSPIGGPINMTASQKKVYELIVLNNKITKVQLAKELGINASAVLKHLTALKKLGVITRMGGTRGYWQVNELRSIK